MRQRDYCVLGLDIRSLGQIVVYKLPSLTSTDRPNPKKANNGGIMSPKHHSTSALIIWCSIGMSHPVRHVVNLRVGTPAEDDRLGHLLVATGSELHVVAFDLISKSMTIVYSEIWRSPITTLVSSGTDSTFAVGTVRSGLDIFRYNGRPESTTTGSGAFIQIYSASLPDKINCAAWLPESRFIAMAEQGGQVIIHDCGTNRRRTFKLPNREIPVAICGLSHCEFICTTISGAIFKMKI